MKRYAAAVLACICFIPAALIGQSNSAIPSTIPTLSRNCPSPPHGGTAWFDTCEYLPIGNGVMPGHPVATPDPQYSETARQAKLTGNVVLAVAVNAAGFVDQVRVVHSVEPGLDANAADAVRNWRFTPATKDGKPVPVQISVEVGFRLP